MAAAIELVREVVPAFELLRVSGMSPILAGMIGLRGDVLPVIDTSALIGEETLQLDARMQFLIVRTGFRSFALLVDTVEDLVEIDLRRLVHPMPGARDHFIQGVATLGEEMVLVLDLEACGNLDAVTRLDDLQPSLQGEGAMS
ncbi:MAG: chemotaxis protein CheW [Bacteroidetes bacterium]|nr:chemotaxis protein CheW [Bacteroidota bacterium]